MIKSGKNKLALAVVGAAALAVAGLVTAGISTTKHNLGSNGPANNNNMTTGAGSTGEICVFCHTPHGASNKQDGELVAVPLWNRSLPASAGYTLYDQLGTSSLDGKVVQVGSVSIACLSCHDGTQAMDVMINEPGSGKDSSTFSSGAAWSTGGTGGSGDTINSSFGITYIAQDLTDDHPIGIQYAGGGLKGTATQNGLTGTTSFKDPDFKQAYAGVVNNMPIWWVPTVIPSSATAIGNPGSGGGTMASGATRSNGGDLSVRNKTDIQLYTRLEVSQSGGAFSSKTDAATEAEPYVECASCHDPHTDKAPTFLRVDNFGSGVCLACHTK